MMKNKKMTIIIKNQEKKMNKNLLEMKFKTKKYINISK